MKVVTAIDSLKGSLTSLEAGDAIREGVLKAVPEAKATHSGLKPTSMKLQAVMNIVA